MLVYHYICAEWGLDDIRKRRLKVLRFEDCNDVFELAAFSRKNRLLRHKVLTKFSQDADRDLRLVCFSDECTNPVMWAHYADRHRGLCLGLDIPFEFLRKVDYVEDRLIPQMNTFPSDMPLSKKQKLAEKMLSVSTKSSGWSYEREWRAISRHEQLHSENGMHFLVFDKTISLASVFVGCRSTVRISEIEAALGELGPFVKIVPTRPAFRTFKIVRQRDRRFWNF